MSTPIATAVRIRMYNVGFGDCFLLTFEAQPRPYTMLIDCGRLSGSANVGPAFETVVAEMIDDLPLVDGKRHIDVVVMTHRHRDHVHGFSKTGLWKGVTAGEVWMPWTENPNDPVAARLSAGQSLAATNALQALKALSIDHGDAFEVALNSITNEAAMTTLRGLSDRPVRYLPETNAPKSTIITSATGGDILPRGVVVRVLGPSRDPKVIAKLDPPKGQSYLRLARSAAMKNAAPEAGRSPEFPNPFHSAGRRRDPQVLADLQRRLDAKSPRTGARAVKVGPLLDGIRSLAQVDVENLAFDVDNALNGTSLVLAIQVGEHHLLFPGDAQWGTWEVILNTPSLRKTLEKTTFLKVGHHGSHNATPVDFVTGGFLQRATAMVSVNKTSNTSAGWKAIPKTELLEALEEDDRVTRLVRSDKKLPPGTSGVTRSTGNTYSEVRFVVGGK